MKIGIVGKGVVGSAMVELFPNAAIYDPGIGIGSMEDINKCDITFLCVPTPMGSDKSCDTSIAEECIKWIESKIIVIRSTVPVGFSEQQAKLTGKNIIFQPEFLGETVAHPFVNELKRKWLILGGEKECVDVVIRAYQDIYNADIAIYITDSKTAELCKYMENSFLALKVTFCNEFFDLANALGVNYNSLRELFLADPRIERSHTFVYEDKRGYSGKCLPKDVNAIIKQGEKVNADMTLMKAVDEKNTAIYNN